MSGLLHAVVPAGGAGTRLWPLSRQRQPKFLLDLEGVGQSMLQRTVDRLTPIAQSVTVVTGAQHAEAVADQLADTGARILVEPSPRDSTAAIAYAAYTIAAECGSDAIVGSFPADHVVDGAEGFAASVALATRAADQGFLATIGIVPTEPSTAFGYIEPGQLLFAGAHLATRFVEKPDAKEAATYLERGYLWNAGMFVFRAGTLADQLKSLLPQLDRDMHTLVESGMDRQTWDGLVRIAIDYALAEPMAAQGLVAVTPAQFAWSDIGDLASLAQLTGKRVFSPPDKMQVILGNPETIVVDTGDVLLVADPSRSQEVKSIVDGLRAQGRSDLL